MVTMIYVEEEDKILFYKYLESRNATTYPCPNGIKVVWPGSRVMIDTNIYGKHYLVSSESDHLHITWGEIVRHDEWSVTLNRGQVQLDAFCMRTENGKQHLWLITEYKELQRWI